MTRLAAAVAALCLAAACSSGQTPRAVANTTPPTTTTTVDPQVAECSEEFDEFVLPLGESLDVYDETYTRAEDRAAYVADCVRNAG